jgi:hypothetical protein
MKLLRIIIATAFVAVATTARAQPDQPQKRFTLVCRSTQTVVPPPIPTWVVDVNLDLRTYFVDTQFGGLGEIVSDNGRRISLLLWRPGLHGLPTGGPETFDRSDGHWYFSALGEGPPTGPDAFCTVSPPRDDFKADRKYAPQAQ